MPVVNGSFELAGSRPGLPAGWTVSATTALWRYAGFDSPVVGFERFAWGTVAPLALAAVFDAHGEGYEDFFEGWFGVGKPDVYLRVLDDGVGAPATFGDDDALVEAFSVGWNVDPYYLLWVDLPDVDASSTGDADPVDYITAWGDVTTDPAVFDGPVSVEDFSDW